MSVALLPAHRGDTSVVVLLPVHRGDTSVVVLLPVHRGDTSVVVLLPVHRDDRLIVLLPAHRDDRSVVRHLPTWPEKQLGFHLFGLLSYHIENVELQESLPVGRVPPACPPCMLQ